MILNPQVWKDGLRRDLDVLSHVLASTWMTEDQRDYHVEKSLFFAAFTVRKLMEGHRIAGVPLSMKIPVVKYARINSGEVINFSTVGNLERFFDLSREQREMMELETLCNGFIHTLVFQPAISDGELQYIIFTTDRLQKKGLYQVEFHDLLRVLALVVGEEAQP